MKRLTTLDKWLVLILVPLWIVCFALAVRTQIEGRGLVHVGLSVEDAESYPALTGEYNPIHSSDPLEKAGLRAGDRLVRMGGADLRGVGSFGFYARSPEEGGRGLSVPVVYERDGERRETSLALVPYSVLRPWLAASLAFAASALFLLLRARPTPMVRAYFYAGLCLAFALSTATAAAAASVLVFYTFIGMYIVAVSLVFPLLLRFGFLFPDDVAPEGKWQNLWPWFFAVLGPLNVMTFAGMFTVAFAGSMATMSLGAVAIVAVVTHKYRRTDRVARRQMKWVLFGGYCATTPVIIASALGTFNPSLSWLFFASIWALPLFPLSLLISVVRFNLFDIDRILSATASYNVILVLLVGGGFVIVPRAAEAASGLIGIDPGTGQVGLSLLLAGLLVPAHRRLRPQIDRVFFKDRYALDHGIAELLPSLSACEDIFALTQRARPGVKRFR